MQFIKGKTADEIVSFLGKGAELKGEIAFTNKFCVEGILHGKVRSDATLEVRTGGIVNAEVHVRRITINGEFRGTIHATERAEIHKNGKVFGEIFSPCLIIEAGAVFDGHCNMSDEKTSAKDANPLSKSIGPDIGKLI